MRVSLSAMQNVGSRYSKFSFEKKRKKKLHLVLEKKNCRAVYYGYPFDFDQFNTNDHRYPYLNSIYKWKYLVSM